MKNYENIEVSVGLVHWPIYDRVGHIVATNVTNLDIHDIARACRSYGMSRYFIVNRMQEQLMYVSRVLEHWRLGRGVKFNPMRRTALINVETIETVEAAVRRIKEISGEETVVKTVTTAARDLEQYGNKGCSFGELRSVMKEAENTHFLILFGTGFGLEKSVIDNCDYLLEPIRGASDDDYRHLSVRSAVSICLDRLFGL